MLRSIGRPALAGHDMEVLNSLLQLDLVFLDLRVGEKFLAHLLERGTCLGLTRLGKLQVDDLALAHFSDCGKSKTVQRMPDGFSLGIENAALQRDEYACLHLTSCGPLLSPWIDSGMMPSRRATSE